MNKEHSRRCELFNVVIEDRSEQNNPKSWVMGFLMPAPLADPEKALREAIADFCKSPEGQQIIADAGGSFNWRDVMLHLPNQYVLRHGMIPCSRTGVDIRVDHDEMLFPSNTVQ